MSPMEVAGCQGVGLSASGQTARLRQACNVQCGQLYLAGSWAALGGIPVPLSSASLNAHADGGGNVSGMGLTAGIGAV